MSQKRSKAKSKARPKRKRKAPPEKRSNAEEDAHREATILRDVIELHPTHLLEDELIRRRGVDPNKAAFAEIDGWRRAVRELRRDGLLQLGGKDTPVSPTYPIVRFGELVDL